jgi:hypothetical protein
MTERDQSPERPRKCEVCSFNYCSKVKSRKIPAVGAKEYEIYDEACEKSLCCRCMQVFDYLIDGESSTQTQCTTCKTSTRKCCVCASDKCKDVAMFDARWEGWADEEGFYCCNHLTWCRTFNDERFEVERCDHCEQIVSCDAISDCEFESQFEDEECSSCHSKGFYVIQCDCCDLTCCTLCHQHHAPVSTGNITCACCSRECNQEAQTYWHDVK